MLSCAFADELHITDVASVLEEYMADCFNTEMEDGSAAQVAEVLLKFYRYCTEGDESTARTELEKLPPLQPWLLPSIPQNRTAANCDSSGSSSFNEGMGTDNNMDTNEAEEGWTTVKSGRRR